MKASATRPLGNSGLQVTALGFGGVPLGNLYRPCSDDEAPRHRPRRLRRRHPPDRHRAALRLRHERAPHRRSAARGAAGLLGAVDQDRPRAAPGPAPGPAGRRPLRAGGAAIYNYKPAPPEIMDKVRRIEAVCARHRVPLASAALQFPLAHRQVATLIPVARSPEEVRQNVATFGTSIPADLWAELKHEGLIRADAPAP